MMAQICQVATSCVESANCVCQLILWPPDNVEDGFAFLGLYNSSRLINFNKTCVSITGQMTVSVLGESFFIYPDLPSIGTGILIMSVFVLGVWGEEDLTPSLAADKNFFLFVGWESTDITATR